MSLIFIMLPLAIRGGLLLGLAFFFIATVFKFARHFEAQHNLLSELLAEGFPTAGDETDSVLRS